MVGDGGERTECEQLARDLGVGNDVRFLGKQDAIEEILSVSDLFLMPSQSGKLWFGRLRGDGLQGAGDQLQRGRSARTECGRRNRFPQGDRRY